MKSNFFNIKFKKIFLSLVVIFIISSSTLITVGIDNYGYGKKDVVKLNELSEYNSFLLETKFLLHELLRINMLSDLE